MIFLIIAFYIAALGKVAFMTASVQEIHKVWPSLREPSFSTTHGTETNKSDEHMATDTRTSRSSTTLVYGSPICVGRCIIFQIFWSNSSSSVLGLQFPFIPTFPRPHVNSTK